MHGELIPLFAKGFAKHDNLPTRRDFLQSGTGFAKEVDEPIFITHHFQCIALYYGMNREAHPIMDRILARWRKVPSVWLSFTLFTADSPYNFLPLLAGIFAAFGLDLWFLASPPQIPIAHPLWVPSPLPSFWIALIRNATLPSRNVCAKMKLYVFICTF